MLSSFAVILMIVTQTAKPSPVADEAPHAVTEGDHRQQKETKEPNQPNHAATETNVPSNGGKRDADAYKQRSEEWTHADVIQIVMAIVAGFYLFATIRLVQHARKANEQASERDAESLKLMRESNVFAADSFKLTHRPVLAIRLLEARGDARVIAVIRNVGLTTAHLVTPDYGISKKPLKTQDIHDPQPFAQTTYGSIGRDCEFVMNQSITADVIGAPLYFFGVLLYRDDWSRWHRYRFIAERAAGSTDWGAHSDLHDSDIQLVGWQNLLNRTT